MNPSGAWTPEDEKQRKQNNTIRLLIEQAEPVTDRDCQAPYEAGLETGLPYPFIRSDFDGAFSSASAVDSARSRLLRTVNGSPFPADAWERTGHVF